MRSSKFTLITGASQGFGRALSLECAKRGNNLVLVALPGSGLEKLKAYIEMLYGVSCIAIACDLSEPENCIKLYDTVRARKIRVNFLINNAGVLSKGLFEDLSRDFLLKQLGVNIQAPTLLSKLFLEDLKNNKPSRILNVGSLASYFFLPKKQVYGASKAYIFSYSKSLRKELRPHGIQVSVVCPGGMNTNAALTYRNLTAHWYSKISIMNPDQVARITMDAVERNTDIIIPGRANKCYLLLNRIIPKALREIITSNAILKIREEAKFHPTPENQGTPASCELNDTSKLNPYLYKL